MTERERLYAVLKLHYSDQILLKIDRIEGIIILYEGLEIARFEEFRISALSVCYSFDCNERGLWFIGNSDSELFFFDAQNLSVEKHNFFQRRVLDDEKGLD